MTDTKQTMRINLKHLLIKDQKQIGMQFYPNKIIQALIKGLPDVKWSKEFNMAYIPNNGKNVNLIFKTFRGVCWINGRYFFVNKPIKSGVEEQDLDYLRKKKSKTADWRKCPESYFQKLEIRKYAYSTAKTYTSCFEQFINHYKDLELLEINDQHIRDYLSHLVQKKRSDSYINQSINSIKFYYEVVLGMPNRFYNVERPKKEQTLPKVLSTEQVIKMLAVTTNLKHKCIISLLYSGGLRKSELQDLKIADIQSDRMLIHIRNAKGKKDRYVQMSTTLLPELRKYFKEHRPKVYLFEGAKGNKYSSTSISNVVKKAAAKAGIKNRVHPHMLRHSFATHLHDNGTLLRDIQQLMGHSSPKTTEIYTHISTTSFKGIKNPLDSLY